MNQKSSEFSNNEVTLSFDYLAASNVIGFLNGDIPTTEGFEQVSGIKLLVARNAQKDPALTMNGFKSALERCRKGECVKTKGLDLSDVQQRLTPIRHFLNVLRKSADEISKDVTARTRQNMPKDMSPYHAQSFVVLGGQTDAYVEPFDGGFAQVFELRSMFKGSESDALTYFNAALTHELWHLLFLKYVKEKWTSDPQKSQSNDVGLVFEMLNEGYGHYLSVLSFIGGSPKRAYEKLKNLALDENKGGFFLIFKDRIKAFAQAKDDPTKEKLREDAFNGNFWKKWGAMTGAMVIATLQVKLGKEATVALLEHNPYDIWKRYQNLCDPKFSLDTDFMNLIDRLDRSHD